jgi:hypothetical protein
MRVCLERNRVVTPRGGQQDARYTEVDCRGDERHDDAESDLLDRLRVLNLSTADQAISSAATRMSAPSNALARYSAFEYP